MHLPLDTVHVWRLEMSLPQAKVEAFRETLTSDERSRADRYHFQRDRNRFIVARSVLRSMLSRYIGIKPENFRFDYTKYGKPILADASLSKEWHFNVSHAESQALYGIARHRRIGVDIEFMRDAIDHLEIAQRFFSASEYAVLRSLATELRERAFFNCWTRKEAYIKAIGEGLSHPLDKFNVSLAPGEPAALLSTELDPQEASRWLLRDLDVGQHYVAAVIAEGRDWELSCMNWQE